MIVTTEAVVLQKREYGDTSVIATLYTSGFGKTSVIAKGARGPKSKFGSSLQPLSYINVTFYKNPQRDLHLLSNSEIVKPLRQLTEKIDLLYTGLLIAESVSQSQEEHFQNQDLFDFFVQTLEQLNISTGDPFDYFVRFQVELAVLLGFHIDFSPHNNKNMEGHEHIFFELDSGLVALSNYHKNTFRLDYSTYQALLNTTTNPGSATQWPKLSKKQVVEMFSRYFSFHLEKKFVYRSFSLMAD